MQARVQADNRGPKGDSTPLTVLRYAYRLIVMPARDAICILGLGLFFFFQFKQRTASREEPAQWVVRKATDSLDQ